jgi:hypothetical protein
MGTRHLIIVKKENVIKIAQYGQWDGYPDGQGLEVLKFLRNKKRIKKLSNNLKKVRLFDDNTTGKDKEFLDGYNRRSGSEFSKDDNRTINDKEWFDKYISRDLGSKILYNIVESKDKEILLKNSYDFGKESLFCEWAYFIDLDKQTLEVLKGFNENKKAQDKRFWVNRGLDCFGKYFGIKLIKTYNFDNLPTDKIFLADFVDE